MYIPTKLICSTSGKNLRNLCFPALLASLLLGIPGPGSELLAQSLIGAGQAHTCVVTQGGDVRCWGSGSNGKLGYGNTDDIGDDETPSTAGDVNLGTTVTQLSSYGNHTCVVTMADGVRCWGFGGSGRLGYGNTDTIGDDETPSTAGDVNVGTTVLQITTGNAHSCALTTANAVRCWGISSSGQLGYGNTDTIGDDENPSTAGDVNVGTTVLQVDGGEAHTCAVTNANGVRCWGLGSVGRLGYGNTNNIGDDEAPASVGDVNVGTTVAQVGAGRTHTCARTTAGGVRCWGQGGNGRLGYGNTDDIGDDEAPSTAGDVNVGTTVLQVEAGFEQTCAVTTGNTVRCWGRGANGRLGYGNTNDIGDDETPASAGDVNVGLPVRQVALGWQHTCVVTTSNTVRCWGSGGQGRLGYGNTDDIGDNENPSTAGDVNVGTTVLPVELTHFEAHKAGSNVTLSWTTASERNNAGFEIHRLFERSGQEFFDVLGFVPGAGTTAEAHQYTFSVEALEVGRHRFRLKQVDLDGSFAYSQEVEVTIEVPGTHVLGAAYPNPFNPRAHFSFAVPVEQHVQVTLHDASGRLVNTLFEGQVPAQQLQWVAIEGEGLSSGMYVYRITGAHFRESRTVTLTK